MVEFRQLVVTAILAALYTFTLIGFGVQIANDNNVSSIILEDPLINETFNDLQVNLTSQQDVAQNQLEGFEKEAPTIGTNAFLFSSIVSAGKTFTSSINLLYNLVFNFLAIKLGFGAGVALAAIGALLTILLVVIILLLWKIYKLGV